MTPARLNARLRALTTTLSRSAERARFIAHGACLNPYSDPRQQRAIILRRQVHSILRQAVRIQQLLNY